MYHRRAHHTRPRLIATLVRIAIAAAIALAAGLFVWESAQEAIREQSALSLRIAILDAAKQCCAIEGAYPQSLGYLKEHYGLVVNDRNYLITYECYADNVVPSVVVVPR